MPDAGVLATILLILGLFLLALELMIPSFGMIGIMSALCLLISAWCAWQAWWGTSPGFFWTYVAFWILGIPAVLGGALFLLQNTSLGDRLVLRPPPSPQPNPEELQNELQHLVGKKGIARSLLTPGGIVEVDGERYNAESLGILIEPKSPVKVVGVKINRLVVKPWTPEDAEKTAQQPPNSGQTDEQRQLMDTIASNDVSKSMTDSDGEPTSGVLDFDIPDD